MILRIFRTDPRSFGVRFQCDVHMSRPPKHKTVDRQNTTVSAYDSVYMFLFSNSRSRQLPSETCATPCDRLVSLEWGITNRAQYRLFRSDRIQIRLTHNDGFDRIRTPITVDGMYSGTRWKTHGYTAAHLWYVPLKPVTLRMVYGKREISRGLDTAPAWRRIPWPVWRVTKCPLVFCRNTERLCAAI